MLDISFIRENLDLVKAGAAKKHIVLELDALVEADDRRRALLQTVEALRANQNEASKEIASLAPPEREAKISEMQTLKAELHKGEEELKTVMSEWRRLMLLVPNMPDITVPEGESDEANQELRTWGELPTFDFTPKDHMELALNLDLIDLERGTKVSGFRGYFLKGDLALLAMALWRFTLDRIVPKGFTPMMAPALVRRESFIGTGFLPQSEEDLYKVQDELYLAGTGEVPTMGYHMDEILDASTLPLKYVTFSSCFRREIGAHGKDMKGLMRVHEFFKVEQVVLCEASHEVSVRHHEELTANAEALVQALALPYHVVVNCGGDLGLGQVKKYDIEVWVPTERRYRETHSSSYFHDFQTRRLNIRYKDNEGKLHYAHSLNNTAVATPRILVAILENYQQADGSIKIPAVLVPYMGKDVIHR